MTAAGVVGNVLAVVAHQAGKQPAMPDELLLCHLRESFPGVHFSLCSDDDMPRRMPFAAENEVCRIYYVSSGGHCLSLTADADSATGLVIARVDPGE